MHFLLCLDARHELEGVMTRVVSTDITVEGTLLNQDTRSMVRQSKVGITRSVVDGALVRNTKTCSRASARNCPGPSVCALVE